MTIDIKGRTFKKAKDYMSYIGYFVYLSQLFWFKESYIINTGDFSFSITPRQDLSKECSYA